MATLALAAEPGVKHEHGHNVHRRDDKEVVTVYVTKYVTAAINAATSTVPTSSSKSSGKGMVLASSFITPDFCAVTERRAKTLFVILP